MIDQLNLYVLLVMMTPVTRCTISPILNTSNMRLLLIGYFQVVFQHMVRHSPLRIEDLFASVSSSYDQDEIHDVEMVVWLWLLVEVLSFVSLLFYCYRDDIGLHPCAISKWIRVASKWLKLTSCNIHDKWPFSIVFGLCCRNSPLMVTG